MGEQHVVDTLYDLSWEGSGNISLALGGSKKPLCVTVLHVIIFISQIVCATDVTDERVAQLPFPEEMLSKYTDGDADSTSCVPVLGNDCVHAIINQSEGGCECEDAMCDEADPFWALEECNSTLRHAHSLDGRQESVTGNLNPLNMTFVQYDRGPGGNMVSHKLQSGDAIYYPASGGVERNALVCRNALTSLQIMVMTASVLIEDGFVDRSNLVYMRVHTGRVDRKISEEKTDEGSIGNIIDKENTAVRTGIQVVYMMMVLGSIAAIT